jgi:rhodanese-related sulfurtransferase
MMIDNIDNVTLKKWLENDEVIIIDVREDDEWDAGHIKEAIHLPLSQVRESKLPDITGKKLVFQCRSGARSMTACQKIEQNLPQAQLYNLVGGIIGWINAGQEVITENN